MFRELWLWVIENIFPPNNQHSESAQWQHLIVSLRYSSERGESSCLGFELSRVITLERVRGSGGVLWGSANINYGIFVNPMFHLSPSWFSGVIYEGLLFTFYFLYTGRQKVASLAGLWHIPPTGSKTARTVFKLSLLFNLAFCLDFAHFHFGKQSTGQVG